MASLTLTPLDLTRKIVPHAHLATWPTHLDTPADLEASHDVLSGGVLIASYRQRIATPDDRVVLDAALPLPSPLLLCTATSEHPDLEAPTHARAFALGRRTPAMARGARGILDLLALPSWRASPASPEAFVQQLRWGTLPQELPMARDQRAWRARSAFGAQLVDWRVDESGHLVVRLLVSM